VLIPYVLLSYSFSTVVLAVVRNRAPFLFRSRTNSNSAKIPEMVNEKFYHVHGTVGRDYPPFRARAAIIQQQSPTH